MTCAQMAFVTRLGRVRLAGLAAEATNDGRRWSRRFAASLALAAVALLAASPGASAASPCSQQTDRTWFCGFTGEPETFTVPDGVGLLTVDAFGGQGGNVDDPLNNGHNTVGGRASEVSGVIQVTPGEELTVWVGRAGLDDQTPGWGYTTGGRGGDGFWDAGSGSAGGGGGSTAVADSTGPLIVAGGGGGGGGWSSGSESGGRWGGDGGAGGDPPKAGGLGQSPGLDQIPGGCAACQSSGAGGTGADGSTFFGDGGGGGGGAGYVGGGGGQSAGTDFDSPGGGGGGGAGSSFLGGTTFDGKIFASDQTGDGGVYLTAGIQNVFSFEDGCSAQDFNVPNNVNVVTIDTLGGGGGSVNVTNGGNGGKGGGTIATVPVKPGSDLKVFVGARGQDHAHDTNTGFGGCGQGHGGNGGAGPGLNADRGAGGGGSSAVIDGSTDLVVGGGGGGGGGEALGDGGDGGSGGNGGPGWPGEGGSGAGAGEGGCSSCTGSFDGADGEDASLGDDGGGGGGGGGGYQGGQGGNSGQAGGGGGGGGGAGRSYAEDQSSCSERMGYACSATDVSYYSAGPLANGQVTIGYNGVGNLAAAGGDQQTTDVGASFASPLSVKVTDTNGNPIPGVPIQFVLPSSGASATFADGKTTGVVDSDSNGVATTSALTATWTVGAWQAIASLAGDSGLEVGDATFSLTNARLTSTTRLSSSSDSISRLGEPTHFTATVDPGSGSAPTPTGTVQFSVDGSDLGSPVPLSGGTADSPALSSLALGDHTVKASYSGDSVELPSDDTLTQTVIKGIALLAGTPSTPYLKLGDSLTDRAVVSGNTTAGTPTGTVSFFACGPLTGGAQCDGGAGQPVGDPVSLAGLSADSSSARSPSFTPTAPGSWCFRAEYSGDASYEAAPDSGGSECFTVPPTVDIPCDASALIAALQAPGPAKTVSLTRGCTYTLTDPITGPDGSVSGLPEIGTASANEGTHALIIDGNGATITRSTASGTPAFRLLDVSGATPSTDRGWLSVRDLTLSNGLTSADDPVGAGIDNAGTVTVTDSTLTQNNSDGGAGGAIGNHASGTLTVVNSTLSGNSGDNGGGISNAGTATVEDSTVAGNEAGRGGGIARNNGTITLAATLVARNRAGDGSDCAGAVTDGRGGHNLIGDGTGCTGIIDGTNGDQVGTGVSPIDPKLVPPGLADNGGPTPTIALEPGSPAIDAVPVAACVDAAGDPVKTDQRGVSRPQGVACDVGAFERDQTPPDTRIDSGPADGSTIAEASATFVFSGSPAADVDHFQCRLDSSDPRAWATCSSPKSVASLADGGHSFEVRAVDAWGNADPTPAARSFTVDTSGPTTTPTTTTTTTTRTTTPPPRRRPEPTRISGISIRPRPLTWRPGGPYPRSRLYFRLNRPATIRLALRARGHGRWRQVAVATLHGHRGANRFRLAGRWRGQMVPARRVQILVKLHADGRWATHKTLRLTVRSPLTTRILNHTQAAIWTRVHALLAAR